MVNKFLVNRSLIILLIFFCLSTSLVAQNVNIPDANFKKYLVNNSEINTNGDDEISVAEAATVTQIDIFDLSISDLTGIEAFSALEELYCGSNSITSIDLSSNTALTTLYCTHNSLTSLDLSSNTALEYLHCSYNSLTSLDVSKNTALYSLDCDNNSLTSLDISLNTALYWLNCNYNSLASLDVSSNSALASLDCVNNSLTSIDLSSNPNLTYFRCFSNSISTLDVSKNPNLSTLNCSRNSLTSLDVSKNPNLSTLVCYHNSISNLDVSANAALTWLECEFNSLTSLDVSLNPNLTTLDCSYNSISSLDVSANTALKKLHCDNNSLTNLDISTDTALLELDCSYNSISSLDVSSNIALIELRCSSNLLTNLDVLKNTELIKLKCRNNSLSNLDVSKNTALNHLLCSENVLTNLNVSANPDLTYLHCSWNELANLDVSANTALTDLYCIDNLLTNLDVSANTALTSLYCGDNLLTSLDLSANTVLSYLRCASNSLSSLDLSTNNALTVLNCGNNSIVNLDLSNNTSLADLYCFNNSLKRLNIKNGNNSNLEYFKAYKNPKLFCIQVDDVDYMNANWIDEIDAIANFSDTTCPNKILVNVMPENAGTITGDGEYYDGEDITLIAKPETGYTFTNWTEDEIEISTEENYPFTVITTRVLVANFTINSYTIDASLEPENSGSLTGAGTYNHGDYVSLKASPDSAHTFVNWTENEIEVSTKANYSFSANADRVLVANNTLNSYTIAVNLNPGNSGNISGDRIYNHGDNVTLTATPMTGYKFTNWTEAGVEVSSETNYSFTAFKDRNLVANFSHTTTIPDINESGELSIYPNPNTGKFKLNLDNQYVGELTVKIFSLTGAVIKEIKLNKSAKSLSHDIELKDIATGTYYINITTNTDIITKPIIINK